MTDATQPTAAQIDPRLDPAPEKLRGVRGWLAWFLLSCFLGPFVLAGQTLLAWSSISTAQMAYLASLVPMYPVVMGFEITGSLLLGVALFATGLAIVQKRPYAGVLAATVVCLLAANYAADIALVEWATGQLRTALSRKGVTLPREAGVELANELRALLVSLIWLWYFFRSKRVRATFGPVTGQRIGQWLGGRLSEVRP